MNSWPRVAVVGPGAVGGYFGGMMAHAGAPVVFIARPAFVAAVAPNGLYLDTIHFKKSVSVAASSDFAAVADAELVLFCVKTVDNADAARALEPHLAKGATVVSLQNGVDNAEQIRAVLSVDVLPAVVYVAASVPAPGQVKQIARGDLIVGPPGQRARDVAEVFERAQIPCRVSANIEGELWIKLVLNCALNAISALGQARYGRIAESEDARKLLESVVREVLAVATAAGIVVPGLDTVEQAMQAVVKLATAMRQVWSSTAQDIGRGKLTEIDSLNGYIARRGTSLGVATPVNQTLATLVRLLEKKTD